MRKRTTLLLVAGGLALAACGGGGDPADTGATGGSTAPTPAPSVSAPPIGARDAVAQQNEQLQQMEQRAASDDPTAP